MSAPLSPVCNVVVYLPACLNSLVAVGFFLNHLFYASRHG